MSVPTVYISHAPEFDRLYALPFGAVSDGQPHERWRELSEEFAFFLDPGSSEEVGFVTGEFAGLDLEDEALIELWSGPRFTAPLLGLADAPAGEIMLAARKHFGRRPSINRFWFNAAVGMEGEEALPVWRACLESGDAMAHFALGYTLYELGRYHEAYRHLRHYTEISPAHPWNWCWYGKAAEAIGETDEAWDAYVRAIELTQAGGDETEAEKLLPRLGI